jgi:hypothetical protein
VFIEAFPRSHSPATLEGNCGDDTPISKRQLSLKKNSYLGLFELCDDVTLRVSPKVDGVGLWLTLRRPIATRISSVCRYAMVVLVGGSFVIMFRNGKHFSVMRSVLIIQACCFFMLDPLFLFLEIFHSLHFIHWVLFCFFWWRCACEVFLEYSPLVRQRAIFFRALLAIPAVYFLFAALSGARLMGVLAISLSSTPPILGVWFLTKAGSTTGKVALVAHMVPGCGAMTAVYIANVLQVFDSPFRDELLCQMIEISVVGTFAVFQMVFHMGERSDESEEHIAKQQPGKFGKIDELLEALTQMDEGVRFDIDPA